MAAQQSGQQSAEDAAEQWRQAKARVTELIRDCDEARLQEHVPATPAWTVLDLVAHVIGVDADTLAGEEADDHNPTWTQAQVDRRAGRAAAELLAEWDDLESDLVDYMVASNTRPLGDLLIHEQDLRGALGQPGARDTEGWQAIRELIAGRLPTAIEKADLAPLRLESAGWTWASGEGEPGAVLRADAFDLARAVMSRRTAAQLHDWTVAGDVGPYLEILAGMGPLPTEPLPE